MSTERNSGNAPLQRRRLDRLRRLWELVKAGRIDADAAADMAEELDAIDHHHDKEGEQHEHD